MKVWQRIKRRNNVAIKLRLWERVNWVPVGYYKRRPFLMPVSAGIGRIEDVRFIVSPMPA